MKIGSPTQLIKVKVFPASSKDEVIQKSKDSFGVRVREKAESGKATKAAKELLLRHFKTNNIRLIKGARARNKIFEIIKERCPSFLKRKELFKFNAE